MCVPSTDPCPLVVDQVRDSDLALSTHSLCDEKFRIALVGQQEELPLIQARNQETNLHHEVIITLRLHFVEYKMFVHCSLFSSSSSG